MTRPALHDAGRSWTAGELDRAVDSTRRLLVGTRVLATLLDNGAPFVALDEAALAEGLVHVPLPLFFTPAQLQHTLSAAGVDTLFVAPPLAARWPALRWQPVEVAGATVMCARLPAATVAWPAGTAKVTFTSGSTGTPKGVCLTAEAMQQVAAGLEQAMAPLGIERHLGALPHAVLLENIAGLMAPRRDAARCPAAPSPARARQPPAASPRRSGTRPWECPCCRW